MKVQLLRAADVKPDMYIEGHPGWWKITEVGQWKTTEVGQWGQTVILIDWKQERGKQYSAQFPHEALVLVGVRGT